MGVFFGLIFPILTTPPKAEAGFFSSIFGDEALAQDTPNTLNSIGSNGNSQRMTLLEANVVSVSGAKPAFKASAKDEKTLQILKMLTKVLM